MKTIKLLILSLIAFSGYSQDLTYTIDIASLTTDTTIAFSVNKNMAWNIQADFTGLTGTVGTFDVLQGNNVDNLNSWSATSLPLNIAPGVVVAGDTTMAVTNSYMGGVYLAFNITKGTLSAGTATITINYTDRQ